MTWVAVAVIGGSVIGAGASIYASGEAADAQKDAAGQNAQLARENRLIQLGLMEPTRQLGYQAQGDLAHLYGYSQPSYPTLNSLVGPSGAYPGGGAASAVRGVGAPEQSWYEKGVGGVFTGNAVRDWLGMGGQRDPQVSVRNGMIYFDGRKDGGTLYGGHINPNTGEVWVDNPTGGTRNAVLSEQATAALRAGTPLEGGPWGRFNLGLGQLQQSGWKYDPEAIARAAADQTPTGGSSGEPGAGNMDRFFTSPDYQFRRNEGISAIDRSAAARGGALSGNAIRANTEFGSNLAAGEYGNYVNRLLAMAGMGQTATNNVATANNQYTGMVANSNTQAGDARASGIMGAANGTVGAINSGLQNWMLMDYLRKA